jgi:hypothetical protein
MSISFIILTIKEFCQEVLAKIITKKADEQILKIDWGRKKKGDYFKEIEASISQMPFIYKGLEGSVIDNFTHINIQTVRTKDLAIIGVNDQNASQQELATTHRLNEDSKILIVGSPGVGKTMFLSYTILNIIKNIQLSYFNIAAKKKFIPIFIPLKAITNSEPSPIIKYILKNNSFIRGKSPIERLLKYSQKGEIFLILDGYDEISFVAKENYIQSEITVLLSTGSSDYYGAIKDVDYTYHEIYSELEKCRVWVSTREEFYRLNPLISKINDPLKNYYSDAFTAVKISGLGQNRVGFVKKIFDKYKSKGSLFRDLLNEELFIQDVDSSHDSDLIRLSRIPLFLTMMCYIYANKVKDEKRLLDNWITNLDALVIDCVNVLLNDLDEYKVLKLTQAEGKAFLKRRNEFTDEKIIFLYHFSLYLLLEGLNLFDYAFLQSTVLKFFKAKETTPNISKILLEYDNPQSDNPNFSQQLIYSGLFKNVSIENRVYKFDFPHRRFKEILALEALKEKDNVTILQDNIANKNLSEFIVLAFENYPEYQGTIFFALLKLLEHYLNKGYVNHLIQNCLKDVKVTNQSVQVFEDWIYYLLSGNKFAIIDKNLFPKISLSTTFYFKISELTKDNLGEHTISLFLSLTRLLFHDYLEDYLVKKLSRGFYTISNIKYRGQILKFWYLEFIAGKSLAINKLTFTYNKNDKYLEDTYSSLGLKHKSIAKKVILEKEDVIADLLASIASNRFYSSHKLEEKVEAIVYNLNLVNKFIYFSFLKRFNSEKFENYSRLTENFNVFALHKYFYEQKDFPLFIASNIILNIKDEISSVTKKMEKVKEHQKVNTTDIDATISYEKSKELNNKLLNDLTFLTKKRYDKLFQTVMDIEDGKYDYFLEMIY